ncbi:MAG: hypothetical protein HY762_00370, partial [Planctomycetes bacterium]|nr:hypothetical protein [Planctomycetota bacterium]
VYESGKLEEKLEYGQKKYGRQWLRFIGPLKGYKAGHILGLAQMAVMALAGDRKLVDYLKARNTPLEGEPVVITTPEKLNKFRRILDSRIVHWGSEIITQVYDAQTINEANEKLNQLVNEYLREGIIQFTPSGASHLNFIIVQIPDQRQPGGMRKCLGLDIQIAFVP